MIRNTNLQRKSSSLKNKSLLSWVFCNICFYFMDNFFYMYRFFWITGSVFGIPQYENESNEVVYVLYIDDKKNTN